MKWIDIKKSKPKKGSRVLACDENGYIVIEEVEGVQNVHAGWIPWPKIWQYGNGTKIVAWMPLPEIPRELCWEDADGEMP